MPKTHSEEIKEDLGSLVEAKEGSDSLEEDLGNPVEAKEDLGNPVEAKEDSDSLEGWAEILLPIQILLGISTLSRQTPILSSQVATMLLQIHLADRRVTTLHLVT